MCLNFNHKLYLDKTKSGTITKLQRSIDMSGIMVKWNKYPKCIAQNFLINLNYSIFILLR